MTCDSKSQSFLRFPAKLIISLIMSNSKLCVRSCLYLLEGKRKSHLCPRLFLARCLFPSLSNATFFFGEGGGETPEGRKSADFLVTADTSRKTRGSYEFGIVDLLPAIVKHCCPVSPAPTAATVRKRKKRRREEKNRRMNRI